jgi:thioredoxin reductase
VRVDVKPTPSVVDVLIVGGGPAGLSAALVLGRCCRNVVLCDDGHPRNASAPMVHGYLGLPAADAAQLRALGAQQLQVHDTVKVLNVNVIAARPSGGDFIADLSDGQQLRARKLLLATGVLDLIPDIPGLRELWGKAAFPCPYCDAWEYRGRRFGVLGQGAGVLAQTRALTRFSHDIVLFSNGDREMAEQESEALRRWGLRTVTEPVRAVQASEGGQPPLPPGEADPLRLTVQLEGGAAIERDVLFVYGPQQQHTPLVRQLGCPMTDAGVVETGLHQSTRVPGVYVAGDAARDIQFAIIAAAEGAAAAFAINRELLHEQFNVPD